MDFDPQNEIVQACLQGIALEDKGEPDAAAEIFLNAFEKSSHDFEKYLTSYFVARHQANTSERLRWLETCLNLTLQINNSATSSALSTLYAQIADCHQLLGNNESSEKFRNLAIKHRGKIEDPGPFFHGTKANLQPGDSLNPGGLSNYKSELVMNHIYFTSLLKGAGLAASLAKGEGSPRVYAIAPTGTFENDPNLTDKKFPGNPTCSYQSSKPLRVLKEVQDWESLSLEELEKWKEKLKNNKGDIIN